MCREHGTENRVSELVHSLATDVRITCEFPHPTFCPLLPTCAPNRDMAGPFPLLLCHTPGIASRCCSFLIRRHNFTEFALHTFFTLMAVVLQLVQTPFQGPRSLRSSLTRSFTSPASPCYFVFLPVTVLRPRPSTPSLRC
jgi:hypothetical protein